MLLPTGQLFEFAAGLVFEVYTAQQFHRIYGFVVQAGKQFYQLFKIQVGVKAGCLQLYANDLLDLLRMRIEVHTVYPHLTGGFRS
ncbi:hypothetical protein FQZ97_1151250 [compost metagenome]